MPMQYLLLIYWDDSLWARIPTSDRNRIHQACGAWHEELVQTNRSRGAMGLQPAATATTLREESGRLAVTDGPFAETREVLGGFEIIECQHLDEAIAIAKKFPGLRDGCTVEIRPTVAGNACQD